MSLPGGGDTRADAADRALGLDARQPGQNVFAQREIARHRHFLQGNAWYQAEYLKQRNLPPETIHPAFRTPGLSLDTSIPIPTMPSEEMRAEQQRRRYEASGTTILPFVYAGHQPSPPPNLHTTPDIPAEPTVRAYYEERSEQRQLETYGSYGERIPVFRPSPKLDDEGVQRLPKSGVKFSDTYTKYSPTKFSPEKKVGFFSRFRGKRISDTTGMADQGQRIPVKAQAVLGAKHATTSLRRSTSKKAFFSRRSSDATNTPSSIDEPQRPSTSMGFVGGVLRKSSLPSKRNTSRATSDSGRSNAGSNTTPTITRSDNLKYADGTIPPTPPSKDTPPDIKAVRVADRTPEKSAGFLSTTQRASPNNTGTYATNSGARLITAPSMHSMHASVHVSNFTQEDKEELKHMDALGIAGWNDDQPPPSLPYSPSVYSQISSPDTFRVSMGHFPSSGTIPEDDEEAEEARPDMTMIPREPLRSSFNTDDTACTSQTIHVYRELERDESITDFMRYDSNSVFSSSTNTRPMEQASPSRNLNDVLATPKASSMSRSAESKHPATPHNERIVSPNLSMSHASAQVSPLRPRAPKSNILPATTFTPQSKLRYKAEDHNDPERLAIVRREQIDDSPTSNVFANKPVMTPKGITPVKQRPPRQAAKQSGKLAAQETIKSANIAIGDPAQDSVECDEPTKTHKKKKRISTTYARDFYRSPETETAKTSITKAPITIETPNVPSGSTPQHAMADRSLRSSGAHQICMASYTSTASINGTEEQQPTIPPDGVFIPRAVLSAAGLTNLDDIALRLCQSVFAESSIPGTGTPISPMECRLMLNMIQQHGELISEIMERMERMETELTGNRSADLPGKNAPENQDYSNSP